jgi:hypothetical protein
MEDDGWRSQEYCQAMSALGKSSNDKEANRSAVENMMTGISKKFQHWEKTGEFQKLDQEETEFSMALVASIFDASNKVTDKEEAKEERANAVLRATGLAGIKQPNEEFLRHVTLLLGFNFRKSDPKEDILTIQDAIGQTFLQGFVPNGSGKNLRLGIDAGLAAVQQGKNRHEVGQAVVEQTDAVEISIKRYIKKNKIPIEPRERVERKTQAEPTKIDNFVLGTWLTHSVDSET